MSLGINRNIKAQLGALIIVETSYVCFFFTVLLLCIQVGMLVS